MKEQPYRLLERSIFCDRMVFVESLKDSNYMSEMELTIYDKWYGSTPLESRTRAIFSICIGRFWTLMRVETICTSPAKVEGINHN